MKTVRKKDRKEVASKVAALEYTHSPHELSASRIRTGFNAGPHPNLGFDDQKLEKLQLSLHF
jgi:hypothetical protein